MKIWITFILLNLPLLFDGGIQTILPSEEYITVYETEDVVIRHHYTVGARDFLPATVIRTNLIYSDTTRVYKDLKRHYDNLDNSYIKFN